MKHLLETYPQGILKIHKNYKKSHEIKPYKKICKNVQFIEILHRILTHLKSYPFFNFRAICDILCIKNPLRDRYSMCKVGIQRNNGRFCWQIQVWSKIVEMKIWALFFLFKFSRAKTTLAVSHVAHHCSLNVILLFGGRKIDTGNCYT